MKPPAVARSDSSRATHVPVPWTTRERYQQTAVCPKRLKRPRELTPTTHRKEQSKTAVRQVPGTVLVVRTAWGGQGVRGTASTCHARYKSGQPQPSKPDTCSVSGIEWRRVRWREVPSWVALQGHCSRRWHVLSRVNGGLGRVPDPGDFETHNFRSGLSPIATSQLE